jgi:hypothetical protein
MGENCATNRFYILLAIHFAAERGHKKVIWYILQTLLSKGQSQSPCELLSSVKDDNGNTVLHYASMKKREALRIWLEELGMDRYAPNSDGESSQDLLNKRPRVLYTLETSDSSNSLQWFSQAIRWVSIASFPLSSRVSFSQKGLPVLPPLTSSLRSVKDVH